MWNGFSAGRPPCGAGSFLFYIGLFAAQAFDRAAHGGSDALSSNG